jgi:hypothetical protein
MNDEDAHLCPVCLQGVLKEAGDDAGHLLCSLCGAQSQVNFWVILQLCTVDGLSLLSTLTSINFAVVRALTFTHASRTFKTRFPTHITSKHFTIQPLSHLPPLLTICFCANNTPSSRTTQGASVTHAFHVHDKIQ